MPDHMKVKLITRDISGFPHRDLEQTPLQTEIQVHWGEKPVPKGYVTMFDLGYQRMDFDGGLDMDGFSPRTEDIGPDGAETERPRRPPPKRKKTPRRKGASKNRTPRRVVGGG